MKPLSVVIWFSPAIIAEEIGYSHRESNYVVAVKRRERGTRELKVFARE